MASPEFAATRYYVTAYMAPGVAVTFLPIWLYEKGITDAQIGLMNTLPMAGLLLMSVFFGRIADRARDWKSAIVIGSALAAGFSLLLGQADGFWAILVVWTLATLPAGLISPVADAATLRMSIRRGFSFGVTRAWGTVGFLTACFVTGYIVLWFGSPAFVWLFVLTGIARWIAAMLLPAMRDTDSARGSREGAILSRQMIQTLRPWVLLPMFAGAILFGNHMVMNAFSALVWSEQGISAPVIGMLIALGAAGEAVTMFLWQRINSKFAARTLILAGGAAAVLRWSMMAFSPPIWLLVILQLGQAFTFTFAYMGSIYFITKRTDESVAAEALSLFGVMQQGLSIVIVSLFGLALEYVHVQAFWIISGLSGLAVGMVLISMKLRGLDASREGMQSHGD